MHQEIIKQGIMFYQEDLLAHYIIYILGVLFSFFINYYFATDTVIGDIIFCYNRNHHVASGIYRLQLCMMKMFGSLSDFRSRGRIILKYEK